MSLLEITGLKVSANDQLILNGVDLVLNSGEVHVVMGPNGSGKSTLANVLTGRDGYNVEAGDIFFENDPINDLSPDQRALKGLFLAFQYPIEIPGVTNMEFLKVAMDSQCKARGEEEISPIEFIKTVRSIAAELDLAPEFLKRGVNDGFSGGEKKRNEILQLKILNPKVAVLDETDSGLDIDAMQTVAKGVNSFRSSSNALLMVTHYQRILNYIEPDYVHVLLDGRIVRSGDSSLALELEEKGYGWLERN